MQTTTRRTVLTLETATILHNGSGLGFTVRHVRNFAAGFVPHAQYRSSLHLQYTEKGKRKAVGYIYDHPSIIVLAGHVDVKAPSLYGAARREGGAMVSESTYAAGDEGPSRDIDAAIKASGAAVVRDFRGHNSHAAHAA